MTHITMKITETIQNNMNTVLDTIRAIMDKDGNFFFNDLRQAGLSRVEVRQALCFLNATGRDIIEMRGGDVGFWQWTDIKWARRDLVKANW